MGKFRVSDENGGEGEGMNGWMDNRTIRSARWKKGFSVDLLGGYIDLPYLGTYLLPMRSSFLNVNVNIKPVMGFPSARSGGGGGRKWEKLAVGM